MFFKVLANKSGDQMLFFKCFALQYQLCLPSKIFYMASAVVSSGGGIVYEMTLQSTKFRFSGTDAKWVESIDTQGIENSFKTKPTVSVLNSLISLKGQVLQSQKCIGQISFFGRGISGWFLGSFSFFS